MKMEQSWRGGGYWGMYGMYYAEPMPNKQIELSFEVRVNFCYSF